MNGLRMEAIAISLGPLNVHRYGIILGAASIIGLLIAIREGKRFGISPDFFMDMMLIGVPSAIIGARFYFVAFKWEDYNDNFWDIFKVWNGGIAIYGALIGAFMGGYFYFRSKGYSFWRIADICAPSFLVGQAIGRWGNFVNQEAYGGEVKESFLHDTLHLPGWIIEQMNVNGVFHHPTFLYESLWNITGVALLLWLRRRPDLRASELLMSYLIWYSIGRFFIEGLRTDSLAFKGPFWFESFMDALWAPMNVVFDPGFLDPAYGNIRVSQLVSLSLIVAATAQIVVRRKMGKSTVRYSDPILSSKTGVVHTTQLKNIINDQKPN
jgi:phosphatidylglycerol:prolipoprotein diacylglycerol transferase